jgi:UDP-N-acetyl-D-galactosamine dehydrogenase
MGLTFKENCPDLRNTKVVDIIEEFKDYNAEIDIYDPWVDENEALHEYGLSLTKELKENTYDTIILAVAHDDFKNIGIEKIKKFGKSENIIFDMKHLFPSNCVDGRL